MSLAPGAAMTLETSKPPVSTLRAWWWAIRPKTLTAASVPVIVGTAIAAHHGAARVAPALAALAGALLIQIGTNLTNDYYDFKKGADTHERVGPTRVTQSGLIAPRTVLAAAVATFGVAIALGAYLVWVGGWPVVAIGLSSVLAGYAYTGGPFPLGYHGLGDVFVFVFFGFVAVLGTYYVQALSLTPEAWLAALPVGAIGTAILVANNQRDFATDAKAGKRTLVVRFGERAGRAEFVVMLIIAYATPAVMWISGLTGGWPLLSWLSFPVGIPALKRILTGSGGALGPALGETARLQAVFGALFAAGLFLG